MFFRIFSIGVLMGGLAFVSPAFAQSQPKPQRPPLKQEIKEAAQNFGTAVDSGMHRAGEAIQRGASKVKQSWKENEMDQKVDTLGRKINRGVDKAAEAIQTEADKLKADAKPKRDTL